MRNMSKKILKDPSFILFIKFIKLTLNFPSGSFLPMRAGSCHTHSNPSWHLSWYLIHLILYIPSDVLSCRPRIDMPENPPVFMHYVLN